jgi:hypothetical protein
LNNFYPQEPFLPSAASAEEQDSVSGIVDSIIYQSEESGYTVCEIEDAAGEPVTVVGIIPYLAEGDKIKNKISTKSVKISIFQDDMFYFPIHLSTSAYS